MSGFKERDAARETRTSEREATAAWHQARDDAKVREGDSAGDRPTAQNQAEAREKTLSIIERGRRRERERGERSRDDR